MRAYGMQSRDAKMAAGWGSLEGFDPVCGTWDRLLREGRLPTCLLLTGRAGIGKHHLLHRLAAVFYCKEAGCGVCDSCRQIQADLHADVLRLTSDSLGLQEAVELQRHVEVHPLQGAGCKRVGGVRVVLVPDIERWTRQGMNRLLKTLEELPPYAHIVFSTSRPKRILPTILSRCVRFPVKGVPLLKEEGEEAVQWHQELEDFWKQFFSASMPADILGKELWARKGAPIRVVESAEAALNQWYRQQLETGAPLCGVRSRRESLRKWKQRALQEKIMINGQLAAEAFALRGLGSGK